jgi:hypothetical protein
MNARTVTLTHSAVWTQDVEIPAQCPHCAAVLDGIETIEQALGRCSYTFIATGPTPVDAELPEYDEGPVYEVQCPSCGETLFESETRVLPGPPGLTEEQRAAIDMARTVIRDVAHGYAERELPCTPREACQALTEVLGDHHDFATGEAAGR